MKSRTRGRFGALVLAVLPFAVQQSSAQTYSVTDLGTLGGSTSSAEAIDSAGEVVGESSLSPGSVITHAFLYRSGNMIDLGTLGGNSSAALGINGSGEIVGYSALPDGTYSGFVYSGGHLAALTAPGAASTAAYAINDSGYVVAEVDPLGAATQSFLSGAGQRSSLGNLNGRISEENILARYGVNASGQVAGYSYLKDGSYHASLCAGGTIVDLGTLGGSWSRAFALNDAGEAVGESYLGGNLETHAFIYRDGRMSDLGTLGGTYSVARSINSLSQIVGGSTFDDSNLEHAFVYAQGRMKDLNKLISPGAGWVLTEVTAINDAGQIAGTGTHLNQQHAFLLTPR